MRAMNVCHLKYNQGQTWERNLRILLAGKHPAACFTSLTITALGDSKKSREVRHKGFYKNTISVVSCS